jgi:cytochrome c551/c552
MGIDLYILVIGLSVKKIYALAFAVLGLTANIANANRQLAVRNGCMGCHADTEYDAPTWPELAAKYHQYQGQADAASIQGDKLRQGKLFKNIKAHRKLSPTNATDLMQWIIDGAN